MPPRETCTQAPFAAIMKKNATPCKRCCVWPSGQAGHAHRRDTPDDDHRIQLRRVAQWRETGAASQPHCPQGLTIEHMMFLRGRLTWRLSFIRQCGPDVRFAHSALPAGLFPFSR
jgi:hypothetical protein